MLDFIKTKMIRQCKAHWRQSGLIKYSLQDQLNAALGIDDIDAEEIKSYVEDRKERFASIKEAIESVDSLDPILNFKTDSDAKMCVYIDKNFPGLEDDEQKLTIALAIQSVQNAAKEYSELAKKQA